MIISMTGFARVSRQTPTAQLSLELKTVNHRFLEISVSLPEHLNAVETPIRQQLRENLGRGRVECSLHVNYHNDTPQPLSISEILLQQLLAEVEKLHKQSPALIASSAIDLLQWPGVVNAASFTSDILQHDVMEILTEAMHALNQSRSEEGLKITSYLNERLAYIKKLTDGIQTQLPELLNLQKNRLQKKFAEAQVQVDPDRLAQELVLFSQRMDVAEELGRLAMHLEAVAQLLKTGGRVGRKLDFMMQELNREANTLGSKSFSASITQDVVNIKVCIEEMREQIQNIE